MRSCPALLFNDPGSHTMINIVILLLLLLLFIFLAKIILGHVHTHSLSCLCGSKSPCWLLCALQPGSVTGGLSCTVALFPRIPPPFCCHRCVWGRAGQTVKEYSPVYSASGIPVSGAESCTRECYFQGLRALGIAKDGPVPTLPYPRAGERDSLYALVPRRAVIGCLPYSFLFPPWSRVWGARGLGNAVMLIVCAHVTGRDSKGSISKMFLSFWRSFGHF